MFFNRPKSKIKAVQDGDLIGYLQSLGVYEAVKEGKYRCMSCGEIITMESIGAIVPKKDIQSVKFLCMNPACMFKI